MRIIIILVLTFVTSINGLAQVNSVASFRGGVSANGTYAGKDFNSIKDAKWRFKTLGAVRSTPTYHKGNLYIGSSEGLVYCLDANTGKKRWAFQASNAVHATVAVAGDNLFFTDKNNNLYALQRSSGKKVWQIDLNANLPYAWGFDYYQSSPSIISGTLYVGSGDGYLYAINESNGKIKWKYEARSLIRSSPTVNNGVVYVGDLAGHVHSVDAITGKARWTFATRGDTVVNEKYGNDYKAIIASVAVQDKVAVIGGRDGLLYALDTESGRELWNFDYEGSWVVTSVAIKDNTVITGTSDARWIHAFDLHTGQEKWKYKTTSSVWASPIIVESTVVAAVNDGFLYGLDFNTGLEKFRYRFGERALSSPVYQDGIIYIGNDDGYVSALETMQKSTPQQPIAKAVFYTSDVLGKYLRPGMTTLIRDYFVAEGYELLDEQKLPDFISTHSKGNTSSVIVFATGYFPPQIVTGDYHKSPLYTYLANGGKIVVLGINPALHQFDYTKKVYQGLNYTRCDSIIGVAYPHNDLRSHYGFYSSLPTAVGKTWGLTQTVPSYAAVDSGQVTPLALDENGRAAYWVKNYGHKAGTGFVQLWITPTTLHTLNEVKQIAEYGLN